MKRILKIGVIFVLLAIGILFAGKNATQVQLDYVVGETLVPLSIVMVLTLVFGAVLGIIASIGLILKTRKELSRVKKSAEMAEREIANLRTIPIKDSR